MKILENRVIIITGAAMRLGFASAKELAARGANLILVDYIAIDGGESNIYGNV